MDSLILRLENSLEKKRNQAGFLRKLVLSQAGEIDFSSNDYLGLARSKELAGMIEKEFSVLAVSNGSGGSRLLSGNSALAEALEQQMAGFFRSESTLLFNSGYTANLAVLSALPKKGDTVLYDELSHASIKDGVRLSLAQRYSFKHNDPEDLRRRLAKAEGQAFVVVESIYSMDGDVAPLREIAGLCGEFGAALLVDEAHTTGIYGEGSGLVTELGLESEVFARIHTFGKAVGSHGACIAGSALLRNFLINFARLFIYTTALPQHSLVALKCALSFLQEHPELPPLLMERISFYRKKKEQYLSNYLPQGCQIESNTAIQAVVIPGSREVKKLAEAVNAKGYNLRPILSPTVADGKERLRICLHTFNTEDEIEQMVQDLASCIRR